MVALQQLLNGLTLGAVYTLVALAFSLVMGVLGVLNIAVAELFMVGGYVGLTLLIRGAPLPVAVLAAMAAAYAAGQAKATAPKVVRAQKFEVVDAEGRVRAMLGLLPDGSPSLELSDEQGKTRAAMGTTSPETTHTGATEQNVEFSLVLFDKQGKVLWQAP